MRVEEMSDFISREDLKARVEHTFDMQDLYLPSHFLEVVDEAPSVESQRWIPVTERMPELVPCEAGTAYSEAVVVLTDDMTVCTAVWNGDTWLGDFDYLGASSIVTHWKSISPLPPKEES